jgi:transglutaminase-like putative cysteine protease
MSTDRSIPATIALAGLTAVSALSLGRLFGSGAWVTPVLAAVLGAHLAAWTTRRAGAPAVVAHLAALLVGVLVVAWLVLPETTAYGVPWLGTLRAAGHQLSQAATDFKKVVAPTPVTDGFLIATIAGVVACAALADWAAFRMQATFEAAIPSFTLFLFSAVLGAPRHMSLAVAAYLAALVVFLVVHQAERAGATTAWFASQSRSGHGALVRAGAMLVGVAVLAALVLGPHIPGAGQPAVIAWRNTDRPGPGNRSTVSPLVDIRGRLVDRSSVEVFSVKSSRRAYWRLTSLDTFDGDIWSSNGSYRPTHGGLPSGVGQAPADKTVQEYSISSLDSIWLPAAYEPERIDGVKHVSYNPDSGSLISDAETSNGLTYKVQSAVPHLTSSELNKSGATLPATVRTRYLALPPISDRVATTARQAIAGARTPYEKALALEHFFRKGDFVYDLTVPAGHDEHAIERFLVRKHGYCEQFAGTYAVLARAVGLPTRVAVGFTPGELESDGQYHVRGLNAHAWPEVYLDGFGWVAFEPTPGRGIPGAESYTGVPEAQASTGNPSTATTLTPPTTAAASSSSPRPRTTQPDQGAQVRTNNPRPAHGRGTLVLLALAVVFALGLVLWGAGVPLAKRAVRRRRRAAVAGPADAVLVAWAEALAALAQAGSPRRPWETPFEYGSRVGDTALAALAVDVTAASYSAGALGADVAARAVRSAAEVEASVHARLGRVARLWWVLDPRPLWSWRPVRRRPAEPAAPKAA